MEDWITAVQRALGKTFTVGDYSVVLVDILLVPVVLLTALLLLRWFGRFLSSHLRQRGVNPDVAHLVLRAYQIVAIAMVLLTILETLNVPLTAFAFISGAVAIGVGFGAQNIINNFISGWILMWERPIRIGDFLEIGDTRGTVEAINARSTRIRRIDGVHLLIPNSQLLENTVVNWTLVDRLTRSEVKVGVAYGSPVEKVREIMLSILRNYEDILEEPAPSVFFEDFADSALLFGAYFWVNATGERDLRKIRSDLRFTIDREFREQGIVIAFPQRDIHVDGFLVLKEPETRPLTTGDEALKTSVST